MQFKQINQRRLTKFFILFFLILMLFRPADSFAGASSGLLLWYESVLPNLLPFIIISGLVIKMQITRPIGAILYPILKHFLPISKEGCYPFFIGFLSGIPVGAKTSSDLLENKQLSLQEGQFLAGLCNNASPMFILGYISTVKLGSPRIGIFLCGILYLSAIISALLCYHLLIKNSEPKGLVRVNEVEVLRPLSYKAFRFEMLDETILAAFEVVTKVGGYIVLFSVLASIVESFQFFNQYISAVITSLLEITVGIHNISKLTLSLDIKIVLIATITAFGGFSGLAQTKSVMGTTGLSIRTYLVSKILNAVVTFILSSIYVYLINIL